MLLEEAMFENVIWTNTVSTTFKVRPMSKNMSVP